MKKAMLVKLSSLGDVIFNIPLANVLKRNGYEVTWLVSEKGIDVIDGNPAVKNAILVPFQRWKKEGFSLKSIFEFIEIIKKIRQEHFDLAIDTQTMFKSMLLMLFSGAKKRVCLKNARELASLGGNVLIDQIPCPNYSVHAVFMYLWFAKCIGLDGADEVQFTLPPTSEETKLKVDSLLKDIEKSKPIVVIAPATTRRLKHWNKDNWKTVADAIGDKCNLVFTGGACDNELISYISGGKFLNLAGKTSIRDLIEIYSRAKLVMAPDSGSVQIARASNIPAVISIFCATPSTMYGPFGDDNKYFAVSGELKCQPCYNTTKCPLIGEDAEQCINYPRPEKIINIVNKILQNSKHSV